MARGGAASRDITVADRRFGSLRRSRDKRGPLMSRITSVFQKGRGEARDRLAQSLAVFKGDQLLFRDWGPPSLPSGKIERVRGRSCRRRKPLFLRRLRAMKVIAALRNDGEEPGFRVDRPKTLEESLKAHAAQPSCTNVLGGRSGSATAIWQVSKHHRAGGGTIFAEKRCSAIGLLKAARPREAHGLFGALP